MRFFRFRVHNGSSNLANFLNPDVATGNVFNNTSSAGGGLIVSAPSGGGREIDPLTGKTSVGSMTIAISDINNEGANNTTANLADSTATWHLLSRRAVIEEATSSSGPWTNIHSGYVTRITRRGPSYEFQISDSERAESLIELFRHAGIGTADTTPRYIPQSEPVIDGDIMVGPSALIGGPILGGVEYGDDPVGHLFGGQADYGPALFRVTAASNPNARIITLQ